MKDLKILLTGGSGFIGKNIVEQLGKKYIFLVPSHNELDLLDAIAVEKYLKVHPVDVVIHAANLGGNRAEVDVPNVLERNLRIFLILSETHSTSKNLSTLVPERSTASRCLLFKCRKRTLISTSLQMNLVFINIHAQSILKNQE